MSEITEKTIKHIWQCPECLQKVTATYDDLAIVGTPFCSDCDRDMVRPFQEPKKKMSKITEIRDDFIDDDEIQHFDAWFDADDDSEGTVVAKYNCKTYMIIFIHPDYCNDPLLLESLSELTK